MRMKRFPAVFLSCALAIVAGSALAQSSGPAFDLVITNGHIIDGTCSPWYSGDVGIRGGRYPECCCRKARVLSLNSSTTS